MAPYIWLPPYVWMPPCMLGCPHMFGCPLYIWMPPYVWMALCMFGCPTICLPVCLDTHIFLDVPICLDDVWMPPAHTQHKERMLCQTNRVSICPNTFGCPMYIHNTKKGCFVRLRGCLYAPIHLDVPLYVWMPLYV